MGRNARAISEGKILGKYLLRSGNVIFVTVGTQDKQFPRLLNAIENISIQEEIVIQSGNTDFKSNKNNIKVYKFLPQNEFYDYMMKSNQVITHAGVGTIISSIKKDKKVIAVPRLSKYSEHVNDHQLQILDTFSKAGYILPLYDFEDLEGLIKTKFEPKEFKSNNTKFNEKLHDEILKLTTNL